MDATSKSGPAGAEEITAAEIDRMIAEGLDDIEHGRDIDGAEAFAQLKAYAAEQKRLRS